MANLFKSANKVAAPKAAAKKTKDEVEIPGLQALAELDSLVKSAGALLKSLQTEVKATAMQLFIDRANGKRPESFRGIDGKASASIECRKRGTNSALSEEEVQMLAAHGIAAQKLEITKHLFAINPAYSGNDDLLEKVSKALEGIVPDDFIVVQEEKAKFVIDDAAMDAAFAKGCPVEVIEAVSCLAIKPKLNEQVSISEIMDNLKDAMEAATPVSDDKAA